MFRKSVYNSRYIMMAACVGGFGISVVEGMKRHHDSLIFEPPHKLHKGTLYDDIHSSSYY
jgi:hypothetical protein